ncbi:uncharacterized protein LOC118275992 [Spodoptera frugiperda]|uniref:Uncharacterized protein LOC118275992 n=1 Tax=Spodoptera frugiperda TaxID=7108 RepID=A0A9R0DEE2_SPOFR|nr:uncharacterized protein LOC118275992 [Spodoptera frugiperda]
MLALKLCIITIICVQNSFCRKIFCDSDDDLCLSNAVNERVFPKIIEGIPGVEPSEPIHLPRFEIVLPDLKYSLLNASMSGVKDCTITFKKLMKECKFEYEPCCPRLILQSEYEVDGKVDAVSVRGKGTFKITYEEIYIHILVHQRKEKFPDNKDHYRILDHTMQLDLRGNSSYEYSNLIFSESGRCVKCNPALREKYFARFEEVTREPLVKAFIDKLMENIRDFHVARPVDELYYKYV